MLLAAQLTHRVREMCYYAVWMLPQFLRHSNASADFCLNVGLKSMHESWWPSSPLASASSKWLANHKGVNCWKAEPQMEQVCVCGGGGGGGGADHLY